MIFFSFFKKLIAEGVRLEYGIPFQGQAKAGSSGPERLTDRRICIHDFRSMLKNKMTGMP
jgi:hypothetical protein